MDNWQPTVQYGFSRVPVLDKADCAVDWVVQRAVLEYKRALNEIISA